MLQYRYNIWYMVGTLLISNLVTLSIKECLQQDAATSKELQVATGLNQSAVSRKLRAMGESIIRLPHGRSPRYALTCNAFGGNDRLPIYMVDSHGNNTTIAYLRPLAHGGFWQCLATDERVSGEFRAFLAQNNPADQVALS